MMNCSCCKDGDKKNCKCFHHYSNIMAWIAVIGMLAIVMVFNNYGMISYDTWRWLHPSIFVVVALLILCSFARCCKRGSWSKACGNGGGSSCGGKDACSCGNGQGMKNCKCGGVGPCQCKKPGDGKLPDTKIV